MTDEMLVAQAQWLPQYADEIPAAKKRLESEKPLGTRGTAGAARLAFKKSMDRLLKCWEEKRIAAVMRREVVLGGRGMLSSKT